MVVAIIALVLCVAGGWGTTILVASQQATANLALKEAIAALQRQTALQDLKIQDVKEAVIKLGNRKE
jgi:hypothetical protein